PTVQNPQAVERVFTTFLRNVRTAVVFFATIFLLAVVVALLAGPSRIAVGIRRFVGGLLDLVGRALGRSGIPLGPVPAFVARYRWGAAPAAIVIAVLVRLLQPTVATAWWSLVCVRIAPRLGEIVAR